MIRRVRRTLARINYYSATRHRTPVNRAMEWALPITMLLAPVAMLVTEALVERTRTVTTITGRLHRDGDGGVVATIDEPDAPWIEAAPVGEWTIERGVIQRGWPLLSATRGEAATLRVNLFDEIGVRNRVAPDAPERRAIVRTLTAAGRNLLAAAGGATLERHWVGSIATVMLWWVVLFFAAAVGIFAVAFAALMRRGKRKERAVARASTGRCANCDYDLRGTEYSARCPECGTLVR